MKGMSEQAQTLLREAGWREGRRFDLTPWEQEIAKKRQAFVLTPVVREFLSEFGGLDVEPEDEDRDFSFDLEGIIGYDANNLYEYAKFLGKKLFPIGMAHGGNLVLGMAEDGSVYGGFAEVLSRIGESPLEALENLCGGGPFERLR